MKKDAVIKAAGIVGLGTLLSRILGLVRLQVIAYIFGYSEATDAFWVGFTIPNLFRSLLAEGALSAAFIPVLSEWLSKKGEDETRKLVNNVFTLLILILLATTAAGILLAPYYIPYLAFGFRENPSQMSLAIRMTQFMFPFLIFISLAALVMAVLNCKEHFTAPAFAPLMFNIAIILFSLALTPKYGIYSLALGVVVGGGMQLLFQVPSLLKEGFAYRLFLSFKDPGLHKIAKLMVPALFGGITLQINIIINRIFASTLSAGSISSLQYAMRLIQFPLGLFAIALSTAIFPTLSTLAAKEKMQKLRENISLGIRMVLLVLLPSSMGLIMIREPLISLLFQHGLFLVKDTLMTSQALFYYSLGLFAMGEVMIITRAFYSLQDIVTPVIISVIILGLNALLNFLLISPLKQGGLALATSISMMVNMFILLFLLRKRLKRIGGKKILHSFLKIILITVIMGMGIFLLFKEISTFKERLPSIIFQIVQVGLGVGVGVSIFSFLSYILKLEEFKNVLRIFTKRKVS
ncbi:MAG: murein biosynthesis integral membrane protein MurJ [Candidatus Aerophobetes bacterium]|nr:murein biosynthesis integral membrane protein MurJ [Candidatus Aerophobetes bacterium]